VNGQAVPLALHQGYVTIDREWKGGDRIDLVLPMPVRRIVAHERVEADRGRVALQRGPIVFAAEWPDNPGGRVRNIVLPDSSPLATTFRPDLLGGVQVITGRAIGLSYDAAGTVKKQEQDFTAIPYYAWANRGRGQMAVWLATREDVAKPVPWPTLATTSKVAVSAGRNPSGVNDAEEPSSSADATSAFSFWPRRGTTEWIEYTFEKPAAVSEVQVYWFDDTGRGQVRVPASWRVLFRDGDEWKPVDAQGPFGTDKDGYNTLRFGPVTTPALRLEVTSQPVFSAGVQEWKVR
jgi:hypothetical protein